MIPVDKITQDLGFQQFQTNRQNFKFCHDFSADGKYVKMGSSLKPVRQCIHGKVARGAKNSKNGYFFEPKPLVMIPDR